MGLIINLKSTETNIVTRNENTTRFYKDIRKYNVMTREEEVSWFSMLSEAKKAAARAEENGNVKEQEEMENLANDIKNLIVNSNQRLCVSAAKNWANGDNLLDYVNEANISLMTAVDKFDYTRGVKFASYALWFIKRDIESYRNGTLPIVRRTNSAKTWSVMSKINSEFFQKNERLPTQDELLELVNEKLNCGIKDKLDLAEMHVTMVDEYSGDSDDNGFNPDVADFNRASASVNDYEAKVEDEFNKTLVSSLLNELEPREKRLIEMRFGLVEINGIKRECGLVEVATELNLTPERIRQLEGVILKKLFKIYESKLKNK